MTTRQAALRSVVEHLAGIAGLVGVFVIAVACFDADLGDRGYVEIGAACVVLAVPLAGASYRVLTGVAAHEDGRGLPAVGRLLLVSVLALVWSAVLVPLVVWLLVLAGP